MVKITTNSNNTFQKIGFNEDEKVIKGGIQLFFLDNAKLTKLHPYCDNRLLAFKIPNEIKDSINFLTMPNSNIGFIKLSKPQYNSWQMQMSFNGISRTSFPVVNSIQTHNPPFRVIQQEEYPTYILRESGKEGKDANLSIVAAADYHRQNGRTTSNVEHKIITFNLTNSSYMHEQNHIEVPALEIRDANEEESNWVERQTKKSVLIQNPRGFFG